MHNTKVNSKKVLNIAIIVYAIIFVAGIVFAIFGGINLDINFKGGTKISYSYEGKIAEKDFKAVIDENIKAKYKLGQSTSLAGDTQTYDISLVGKKSIKASDLEKLTKGLTEKFNDSKIELYNSNSVSPSVAGSFFAKSLVAVLITAILVVIYVGIRFKRIGGVTAALTALVALVLDVFVSFFVCIFFGLQIDANFIAVVLTLLGYSLNDTIVVYDRVRENRGLNPDMAINDVLNMSISQSLIRNIVTTVTTLLAVITIVVVSEIYGLTTLRSFAIPMAFGLASGCVSSLFIAGPIWVCWQEKKAKKFEA